MPDFIRPDWPAPDRVRALQTTRMGGVSRGRYATMNLGDHVGDDPACVGENRRIVRQYLPGEVLWMKQVHGVAVAEAGDDIVGVEADAALSRQTGQVCVVLTADCLPVLLCDRSGTVVAAVHAGWRGLCAGVIEQTVAAMGIAGEELLAWLGPAIGSTVFEVGEEVRAAFLARDEQAADAFLAKAGGKWLADIYLLARLRLGRLGVTAIYGGEHCTLSESERFFSYRRDGETGRMGSFIWLENSGV